MRVTSALSRRRSRWRTTYPFATLTSRIAATSVPGTSSRTFNWKIWNCSGTTLPRSPLEDAERLEQLRALANGIGIAVATVAHSTPGIDVRPDYDAFLARRRIQP